jgi:threonine dehydrogenase-like Zn-dependent dehydrogenase
VVVPFTICCGECDQCRRGNWSVCERTNRNKAIADKVFGHSTAGLFGYTHLTGGYAGGHAEYVRVPYADVAPVKVDGLSDEQALFLGDIFPTGWQAAVQCEIQPEDTVAVWGAGPVGQFALRSALMLGAKQVIAIDCVPERLSMARAGGAIPVDFEEESVLERLNELTQGKGPEKCIDAVGLEAHITPKHLDTVLDRAKQALMVESDRPHVLREMIYVCRPAGVLSVPGVYGGLIDKIPFGAFMNKGLTLRTGQTHVNRWADDLLKMIQEGKIDPSFVITHTVDLEDGPAMFETFRDKEDGCVKVVMKP